jgi:valyl-tRNA synthetase
LEIVTSRQWFVRTLDLRDALLRRGEELRWHPPYMAHRYRAWVEGLNSDWNVSRQRFFGVPIPLWYPVDDQGRVAYDRPLTPSETDLPVDPSTDVPEGYRAEQRGEPGGFVGDPDVFDTWATSSLTPQIGGHWVDDPDLFARVFPMDLRPQAHEIIRTWLFSTVVRAHLEHDSLPFTDVAISGWVLDPDRKKMSKSKGNAVTPVELLERLGSDAVRYWAACGRPGTDTAYDDGQMKVGRRLAIKILNASKFVLGRVGDEVADPRPDQVTAPLDRAVLASLAQVVEDATAALDAYDWTRALERTESFFWSFCDDYLELVKSRAYGDPEHAGGTDEPGTRSARAALALALESLLRLFAPFLPFVTEEVWSWWHEGSVHRARWPEPVELTGAGPAADPEVLVHVSTVLGQVRREKTAGQRSMRARVARLTVHAPAAVLAALEAARSDLADAGGIDQLDLAEAAELTVRVELAPDPPG